MLDDYVDDEPESNFTVKEFRLIGKVRREENIYTQKRVEEEKSKTESLRNVLYDVFKTLQLDEIQSYPEHYVGYICKLGKGLCDYDTFLESSKELKRLGIKYYKRYYSHAEMFSFSLDNYIYYVIYIDYDIPDDIYLKFGNSFNSFEPKKDNVKSLTFVADNYTTRK